MIRLQWHIFGPLSACIEEQIIGIEPAEDKQPRYKGTISWAGLIANKWLTSVILIPEIYRP